MKHLFGIGGPEIVGLTILGATIGAVACGAGVAGQQAHIMLGSASGAVLLPSLFLAPWSRLRRRPRGSIVVQGSNLA